MEPEQWRQGLGRKLIDHCAGAARIRGAGAINVIGNPHAERFYLACGFEPLETVQTRFAVGLLLRKPL